jgi:hypothetical protein
MAERMSKLVNQIVETEYKRLDLDRMEAQRAVDNLEEYERLSKMCPDSQAKMPQWQTQVQQKTTSKSYGANAPHVYRPANR